VLRRLRLALLGLPLCVSAWGADPQLQPLGSTVGGGGPITVFTNMNGSAVGTGFGIGLVSGNVYVDAVGFNTGGGNLQLSQIQTIASFGSGTNEFVANLYADANGIPGMLLETWYFYAPATNTPSVITMTSLKHPNLLAGLQYWLTLGMEDSQSSGTWYINPGGRNGPYTNSENGGAFFTGNVSPAFAITVTGVPTGVLVFPQTKLVGTPVTGTTAGQGVSVALSDVDTAVVGGFGDNSSEGAVWGYGLVNGQWTQELKLVPTGAAAGDEVGRSVAISGDGGTILVGAPVTNGGQGATYAFFNRAQAPTILASDHSGVALQGYSVALSHDGTTAVIGGPADNGGVGACWVFSRSGNTWTEQFKAGSSNLPDIAGLAQLGKSVAISRDGNYAFCGGPGDGNGTGAVWVMNRAGGVWQAAPKLVGSNGIGEGASVATNSDGTIAVFGGVTASNSSSSFWTFTRSGTTWTEEGVITGQGRIVALPTHEFSLLTADPTTNPPGEAWLFGRVTGGWSQRAHLTGNSASGPAQFGNSVALGERNGLSCGPTAPQCLAAMVGGPNDSSNAGAAWAFFTAPQILSIRPASAPVGGAPFTLTVNGSGFTPSSAIQEDVASGVIVLGPPTVTFVNSNQVTVPVGPGSSIGTRTVQVSNSNGASTSNPSLLTVVGTPSLTLGLLSIPAGGKGTVSGVFSAQGNSASALGFSLAYDSTNLTVTAAPSTAAAAAGKQVQISPGPAPVLVFVYGGNSQLPEGDLVDFTITAAANAPLKTYPLTASAGGGLLGVNADFTSYYALPLNAGNGSVTVFGPTLSIAKTHTGNFTQGQTGTYTITAGNIGHAPTSGLVTVTEMPPAGMTVVSMAGGSGSNWNCPAGGMTCTRSDVLAAGGSYDPITVTVSVSATAGPSLTNGATFSGGGAAGTATASDLTTITAAPPAFTITKSHTGNFTPGQNPATYTITVTNIGSGATSGPSGSPVTVTENIPSGLTLLSMAGTGWTCPAGQNTCTRSDAVQPGQSSSIMVTVSVSPSAPANVTNQAVVSGGGASLPQTANDLTAIAPAGSPVWTITKTHSGNFTQGQTNATYTITVINSGTGPTSGQVTVTENTNAGNSPGALTITGMSGTGWNCPAGQNTCTRSDPLTASVSYSITVTAAVAANAGASVNNQVTVSGGGAAQPQTATDVATVTTVTAGAPAWTITKSHTGNFSQGQNPATYTITVSNSGSGATSGTATVTENMPTGLTLVSMTGTNWTCTPGQNTCTRSDALQPGVSYDSITVTASVSPTAPGSVTNQATVSGGGVATPQPFSDPTTITAVATGTPAWSITKSHSGNFTQGQNPATYTITVTNSGNGPTSGTATVAENIPSGLTLVSMTGTNWTCAAGQNTCTRSDALQPGVSYDSITVTASVSASAPASVTNHATVSGGGATTQQTASDMTIITSVTAGVPGVGSVTPVASSGATQIYTVQFSDSQGVQNLGVVNLLINQYLDGRQACYIAFAVASNVLYLVPDSGGGLLPGMVLNGSGSTANSQCSISGAGSSASASGNTLSLTLNITFSSSFGGNKVVYAAAGDSLGPNTGWNVMGVHGVPPAPTTFPIPLGMTPASSTASSEVVTFRYEDAATASNLQTMWALTNTAIDGRAACYVAYYAPGNQVFLVPDNGDGTQATAMPLSGTGTLSNSQCTVSAAGSGYTTSGGQGTLMLNMQFKSAFAGRRATWLAVQTLNGVATSDWQALGARTVTGN